MWFKNLCVFRLPAPWKISAAEIEKRISDQAFTPCSSIEPTRTGWVPRVENGALVHSVNKQYLLRLQTEKKLLPSSVVNQFVKVRAAEMEEKQGFAPGRKQRKELKENLIDELLPKSFSLLSVLNVWIDPVNGWLGVDTSSRTKAEQVLKFLIQAFDRLEVESVRTAETPAAAMTSWLINDEAPSGFTVDNQSELKSTSESKATVAYKNQSVDIAEVRKHIESGKRCTKLAMTWNDRLSFVLTDGLFIKRIEPLTILKEADDGAANEDERFDADFTLMAAELSGLLTDVIEALGGYSNQAEPSAEAA